MALLEECRSCRPFFGVDDLRGRLVASIDAVCWCELVENSSRVVEPIETTDCWVVLLEARVTLEALDLEDSFVVFLADTFVLLGETLEGSFGESLDVVVLGF